MEALKTSQAICAGRDFNVIYTTKKLSLPKQEFERLYPLSIKFLCDDLKMIVLVHGVILMFAFVFCRKDYHKDCLKRRD